MNSTITTEPDSIEKTEVSVKILHEAAEKSMDAIVKHVIEGGELLRSVTVPDFKEWARDNLDMPLHNVRDYMRLAQSGGATTKTDDPLLNYEMGTHQSLDDIAKEINAIHQRALTESTTLTKIAREAGKLLSPTFREMGHEHFDAWLKSKFSVPVDSIYAYLAVGMVDLEKPPRLCLCEVTISRSGPSTEATVYAEGPENGTTPSTNAGDLVFMTLQCAAKSVCNFDLYDDTSAFSLEVDTNEVLFLTFHGLKEHLKKDGIDKALFRNAFDSRVGEFYASLSKAHTNGKVS
jgi:hypothetical protein